MVDFIIVGAGFAGCVMAERLAKELNKKVLIIEKRDHYAGNCYDFKDDNGILIHQYGPHLFHTNNKKVVDYLSNFTSWQTYSHEVLAYIDGKKVSIPFNFDTLHDVFPKDIAQRLEKKLCEKYEFNSKVPILELLKEEDEDLKFLAKYIYDKVFVNYTAKQWGMKPEDLDSAVTARVPVFIGRDKRYFNDKYQMIPKNGYTKLFKNILNHKNIKLMTNTDFNEVCQLKGEKFYFLENEFKGKVIYTGHIDELFDYKFGKLPYRSVDMVFETVEKEFYQEKTTVNYPNDYDFTRITEFKHILNCKSEKTTILKEYPQEYIPGKNTPYYPIFTKENQKAYEKYEEYSKGFKNLILLGRLAEYKYYDMDDVVKRSLEVFESLK